MLWVVFSFRNKVEIESKCVFSVCQIPNYADFSTRVVAIRIRILTYTRTKYHAFFSASSRFVWFDNVDNMRCAKLVPHFFRPFRFFCVLLLVCFYSHVKKMFLSLSIVWYIFCLVWQSEYTIKCAKSIGVVFNRKKRTHTHLLTVNLIWSWLYV